MIISESDLSSIFITVKLASLTTIILLVIGTPIAWWLVHSKAKLKILIEAIIALPLVLPPTVLGFYLLIIMGPKGPFGELVSFFGGGSVVFSFTGLLIGSIFYSLPFVVQPLKNSFLAIGNRPLEVAATLGATPLDRFFSVAIPLAKPGYITAAVLGFAHTLGEFGVVLMIGGSIPGETKVLSIAIYDHVESMNYLQAHILSGGLLILSFLMLVSVFIVNKRSSVGIS